MGKCTQRILTQTDKNVMQNKVIHQTSTMAKLPLLLIAFLIVLPQVPILLKSEYYQAHREADRASVAKNFKEFPNIFKPRIDTLSPDVKTKSGIMGMEFPLYQYIVSVLFRLFNSEENYWGMVISLTASLFAFLALTRIYPYLDQRHLLIMYYSCPIIFIWSHKFMPGMFGLAFSLWGFCFFHRKKQNLILANTMLLTGALIRPFLIFFFIPFVWDFIKNLFQKKIRWDLFSMGFASLSIFYAWYFWWCPYLDRHYGSDYFNYKGNFIFENILLFFDYNFYIKYWKIILIEYFGTILTAPFIIGIINLRGKIDLKTKQLLAISLLALTIIPIATNLHIVYHPDYLLALTPFLIVIATLGIQYFKQYPKWLIASIVSISTLYGFLLILNHNSKSMVVISLMLPLYISYFFIRNIYSKFSLLHRSEGLLLTVLTLSTFSLLWFFKNKIPHPSHKNVLAAISIAPIVQEKTQKTDFFVTNCPRRSIALWLVKRKGFRIPNATIENLITGKREVVDKYLKKGVSWILYYNNNRYKLISLHRGNNK